MRAAGLLENRPPPGEPSDDEDGEDDSQTELFEEPSDGTIDPDVDAPGDAVFDAGGLEEADAEDGDRDAKAE